MPRTRRADGDPRYRIGRGRPLGRDGGRPGRRADRPAPVPQVPDTPAQAPAAGLRVAVCSNLAHAYGPAVHSLVPGLDAYVLSYEVGVTKPHQTMYRLACAELRCAPADALFVGDSKRCDFEGPKAFGMQARWLDRRGGQSL